MGPKGLTCPKKKAGGNNEEPEEEWISAAFEILGACRDPNGESWGKYLRWNDGDGRVHLQHVTDAALQGDPVALCAYLASGGLLINRGQQRALAIYLCGAKIKGRVTIVGRTGWHEIGGQLVFVLEDETIGPIGSETVVLDAAAIGHTLRAGRSKTGKPASAHWRPAMRCQSLLFPLPWPGHCST